MAKQYHWSPMWAWQMTIWQTFPLTESENFLVLQYTAADL